MKINSPMQVADTPTEKAVVATLMAIDAVSFVSPFRWLPELTRCGTNNDSASNALAADAGQTNNPCDGIDCDGHGTCAVTPENVAVCACEDAYRTAGTDGGPQCIADTPTGFGDGNSKCLNSQSISMTTAGGKTYTAECGAGSQCSQGACRTAPGSQDSFCATSSKISNCVMTDLFDVGDAYDHNFQDNSTGYYCSNSDSYHLCGDDAGFVMSPGGCQFAASLAVTPPPQAVYYRLDAKMYVAPITNSDLSLEILFGDDQRKTFQPGAGAAFQSCVFQPVAYFTADGIDKNSIRVNILNRQQFQGSAVINKIRVWSCNCD